MPVTIIRGNIFKIECDAVISPNNGRAISNIINIDISNSATAEDVGNWYKKSFLMARQRDLQTIALPVICPDGSGLSQEECVRIVLDEAAGNLRRGTRAYLVIPPDENRNTAGELDKYISKKYIHQELPYGALEAASDQSIPGIKKAPKFEGFKNRFRRKENAQAPTCSVEHTYIADEEPFNDLADRLDDRIGHMSDSFSEYLMYLISSKDKTASEVYKKAIIDKKLFSKIKNNPNYHPNKMTAMCLCIGAELNMDEARDLLSRAGYALSPCDKTDVIFSFFIENEIYDMIELDIQLEEHGLKCLIS